MGPSAFCKSLVGLGLYQSMLWQGKNANSGYSG